MDISVGKNHILHKLGFGIVPRLLFPDQRIKVFGFRFQHNKGLPVFVQKKEIDKTVFDPFKVLTVVVDLLLCDLDICLKLDIGRAFISVKESPAGGFKQFIDFDSGFCLFCLH